MDERERGTHIVPLREGALFIRVDCDEIDL
jgi:hypothetical protein